MLSRPSIPVSNLDGVVSFRIPLICFLEALEFAELISDSVLCERELCRRLAALLNEFLVCEVSLMVVEKLDCDGLRYYLAPILLLLLLLLSILVLELLLL